MSKFHIDHMMRYSLFVPRLYNLCLSLGFEAGKITPSRAFCSDENQGFPIILIAKHFGAFPFNHGRVGGIVATDRHGPHADHGEDMVIIQASHVGYDPETETFGSYCRLQTTGHDKTITCGKIGGILQWYLDEYRFAQKNIYLGREEGVHTITIDNHILNNKRAEGLFLELDKLVAKQNGDFQLLKSLSTSRVYAASKELCQHLPEKAWNGSAIGDQLGPEMFTFHRMVSEDIEGYDHLENNLINAMPWIITSESPLLIAAQVSTQAEFDRAYRTIVKEPEYVGKRLLFISCLNIDISPREGQVFPLTKCIPWAAYVQDSDGKARTIEQDEIVEMLNQQSTENPDQINLEAAIQQMIDADEIKIKI
ncbi:MAG: hypothetical protein OQK69_07000 [Gammaproteobacteria bacterium]|nr:hypothetical protein [Gammaproteobacteria bacterium]